METPLTPDGFVELLGQRGLLVSHETVQRLRVYAEMLIDWQTRMNLVGPATLSDIWRRHLLDSAQLALLAPLSGSSWIDLGTGAGFPGLVLAILGAGEVHLVDATAKKCRFLEAVAEATGVSATITIHNARIEDLSPFYPQFITSRACAPLARLLPWAYRFQGPKTRWLLLKGQDIENELTEAGKSWRFERTLHPSLSDARGQIVDLANVRWRKH